MSKAKEPYVEAEEVIHELIQKYGWLQENGEVLFDTNVAIVASAVKPNSIS